MDGAEALNEESQPSSPGGRLEADSGSFTPTPAPRLVHVNSGPQALRVLMSLSTEQLDSATAATGRLATDSLETDAPAHSPEADSPARRDGPARGSEPAGTAPPTAGGTPRGRRWTISFSGLALAGILALQVFLSSKLLWSNTAFLDEATYLFAGQQELAHLVHGAPVESYSTYFSGSPVIYPVLAGLLNNLGGLTAARLFSLGCMLVATLTLWDTTRRLLGIRAALFAAALFAVLGPTQFLSSFATYDAMSLSLLTVAAWLVVAAKEHEDSTWLLLGAAVVLALANATKYASALWDPTVVLLAALGIAERRGWKAGFGRAGCVATFTVGLLSLMLFVGGPDYMTGLLSTTVARAKGTNSPLLVLADSGRWIGFLVVLAFGGALAALWTRNRPTIWLVTLLAVTGLLAPVEQARIHTTTSLSKHVDFGAWFAAIAAGYLLARLTRVSSRPMRVITTGLVPVAVLAPMLVVGRAQASGFFRDWPNATNLVATLRADIAHRPGPYLAEDYDVPAYYLESARTWQAWQNTWYFTYRPPGSRRTLVGQPAYAAAVKHRFFSLIVLDFGDTAITDHQIASDIATYGGYRLLGTSKYSDGYGPGQFTIWGRVS